jgi:glutamyl-Q tRNA(Asp) synthetase
MGYCGRFAPSPTGPLHFGSLIAALGSFLDARSVGGQWLVRIEDLDRCREVPGAADQILRTLEAFGLSWDGPVLYQSRRQGAYIDALETLRRNGYLYPCACSRLAARKRGLWGPEGPIYPGTCRNGLAPGTRERSLRLRTQSQKVTVTDRIRGVISQDLERDVGDFVLRRADGLVAYQLAVVVDDAWQGVTAVVRGADLLLSTPRQAYLQTLLGLPRPSYAHLPLAVDRQGRKLSKQLASRPLDPQRPAPALGAALRHLGQPVPQGTAAPATEILAWAIHHWDLRGIPTCPSLPAESPLQDP